MSCLDVQNKCLRVSHDRQYVTFECTYPRCPFLLQGKEHKAEGGLFVSIHQFVPHDHQIGGGVPDGVSVALFRKVCMLRVKCRQDQIELDDIKKKLGNTVGSEHQALMKKKNSIVQRAKYRSENLRKSELEMQNAIANPSPLPVQLVTVATNAIREQANKDRKEYNDAWFTLHQPPPDAPQFALPVRTKTMPAFKVLDDDIIVWNIDLDKVKDSTELRNQVKNTQIAYRFEANGESNPTDINLNESL